MNKPAMLNTIPGVIVSCAETFFGHKLDDLCADRKRIIRDLLSSYLEMPIPTVNNTFRLWPRPTDGFETDAISFCQEREELDTVISMMLEPDMEDEIFSELPEELID